MLTQINPDKAHKLLLKQGITTTSKSDLIGRVALLHCRNGTTEQCDQTFAALKEGCLVITCPPAIQTEPNEIQTHVFSKK